LDGFELVDNGRIFLGPVSTGQLIEQSAQFMLGAKEPSRFLGNASLRRPFGQVLCRLAGVFLKLFYIHGPVVPCQQLVIRASDKQ
jgi:hypothetical protein